jgi:CheY-like chemotaxis protein
MVGLRAWLADGKRYPSIAIGITIAIDIASLRTIDRPVSLEWSLKREVGKFLHFPGVCLNLSAMTKPLALILYENLLPGSKLVNRMQDLGYRVQTLTDPAVLAETAERQKPMLIITDLTSKQADVCGAIEAMKSRAVTGHVPVIAFTSQKNQKLLSEATKAGANLVASSTALLDQLPQLLEQVLEVD